MAIQINPKIIAARQQPDLHDALAMLQPRPPRGVERASASFASECLAQNLAAAASPVATSAFIQVFERQALAQAAAADHLRQAGAPVGPLAGLAVSVKDLFDVAGQPATGGSRVLRGSHSAVTGALAADTADSPAVARLRAAGATLVGHTNLTEFAFSGVGINPHHGTPINPVTAMLDATQRIPGGSTSGGAVSVSVGAAWAALGSDTGGSIRIPAALQGLVGYKNTQALTPLAGCIPLSPTLDTACAITLSVRDAVLLHEVLAARSVRLAGRTLRGARLAVPRTLMLDALDNTVARAFERSLAVLRAKGASVEEIVMPELIELGSLQARAGFAATEALAWHRKHLAQHAADYDPRVAFRIRAAETTLAADYLELHRARGAWIARMAQRLQPFDAFVSPTVPVVAPPLAPLLASDDAFFRTNSLLLRNPSVVNLMDGCAISLPCQAPDELPVGLMLWAGAHQDDMLLDLALAVEAALAPPGRRQAT